MEKAILENKLLVPAHLVPVNALQKFEITLKDSDGENINYNFYDYNHETGYYEFARGNIPLINEVFSNLEIEDRRSSVPMDCNSVSTEKGYGLVFNGKLRENQQEVADILIKNDQDFGQIKAPPRFGKTVLMTYMTCKYQQKTLFLAHQSDLMEQALKTFYKFTNLCDVEYILNKKIAGLVEKWEDLDKYDICFMPYQKFTSKKQIDIGKEQLQKYKNRFGCLWIDESHKATAGQFSAVISALNTRRRIGVSGTTEKKDKSHKINDFTIGPVVAEGHAPQIPCRVKIVPTGINLGFYATAKQFFNFGVTKLSQNKARNDLIVAWIAEYAKQGHSIIAVSDRTPQIEYISKRLNALGFSSDAFHGARYPSKSLKRKKCLDKCRSGETQILIARRTMVLGLDIPRLTAFFNLLPTANPPNYYQELSRVRTPFENKDMAYIVDFIDMDAKMWCEKFLKSRSKVYNEQNFLIER